MKNITMNHTRIAKLFDRVMKLNPEERTFLITRLCVHMSDLWEIAQFSYYDRGTVREMIYSSLPDGADYSEVTEARIDQTMFELNKVWNSEKNSQKEWCRTDRDAYKAFKLAKKKLKGKEIL